MNKKLCDIGLSDPSVLENSGFLFLTQTLSSRQCPKFTASWTLAVLLTRILSVVTTTAAGHASSVVHHKLGSSSFPHDSGFVLCSNDVRFCFSITFLLDGVLKGNIILFSRSERSPCSDSASTSQTVLPTASVLRGAHFGRFAFREEGTVCPFFCVHSLKFWEHCA